MISLHRRRPTDPAAATGDLSGHRLVGAGDWTGTDQVALAGRRLGKRTAPDHGASVGQVQGVPRQDLVAVCGRSGHSWLALWSLRHHPRSAHGRGLVHLPGTGGLREPHQGSESRFRSRRVQHARLLSHGGCLGLNYAGLPVSPGSAAFPHSAHPLHPAWPGAGHRRVVAPRRQPEQTDAFRTPLKTCVVRRPLGQRLRSASHSWPAK